MAFHTPGIHRTLASAIGVGALVATAPTAVADPPNCTAADLAGVAGGVTVATSACLFTHPEVNGFFTGLKGLTKDEMSNRVADYMTDNPQVASELQGIRQPLVDFHARCGGEPGDVTPGA